MEKFVKYSFASIKNNCVLSFFICISLSLFLILGLIILSEECINKKTILLGPWKMRTKRFMSMYLWNNFGLNIGLPLSHTRHNLLVLLNLHQKRRRYSPKDLNQRRKIYSLREDFYFPVNLEIKRRI